MSCVGTTVAAAIVKHRRGAGCDVVGEYIKIARNRAKLAASGSLPFRRALALYISRRQIQL